MVKDGTLRAGKSGGGRKRLSEAAPLPHDSVFCWFMFGETDKVKQARDSAPAALVWRRAAPPLVYDKRISKCQVINYLLKNKIQDK